MERKTVLVVFGGESSEHEVSIMSARNVVASLDSSKYDVKLCYITKDGAQWQLVPSIDERNGPELRPMLGQKLFAYEGKNLHVDVIFPVLHGKNGEDGTVQGLADLLHTPIVGCGVMSSALAMDKYRTKMLLENSVRSSITTAPWIVFKDEETFEAQITSLLTTDETGSNDFTERLGNGPWFVKPSRGGSSVGVTKVEDQSKLNEAIRLAFEHDDTVLVERAIVGRELEVAVLGNAPNITVSGVGEIVPGDTFYSYEDKYSDDSRSQAILSAELPEKLKEIIQDRARSAYLLLGCEGLARIDFLLSDNLEIYLNEINTLPGFTNISMYPKLLNEMGISNTELCDTLVTLAEEAFSRR